VKLSKPVDLDLSTGSSQPAVEAELEFHGSVNIGKHSVYARPDCETAPWSVQCCPRSLVLGLTRINK
jgi:hypothetical protein